MSDTNFYATPAIPPPLLGRGRTITDPVFGSTIIQLSDATDSAFQVNHSYGSHYALNYDNTYFIANYYTSAGGGVWKTTPFDPTTYAVGTPFLITIPGFTALEPVRWDTSGTKNNIAYSPVTGSGPTSRRIYEWNATTHVSTLLKDFELPLRRPGTVTTSTSSTQFAASAYVSPINDLSPQHFEAGQMLTFTGGTGGLAGQSQRITAFDPATKTFTTAAFTGPPGVGATFYVIPFGTVSAFNVSRDARYFTLGIAHSQGPTPPYPAGGQDTGHILCVWDRQSPPAGGTTYIHYFTKAQFAASGNGGWHQVQMDKAPGSHYIWSSIVSEREVLIDFIAGTVVNSDSVAYGHADTSSDGRICHTGGTGQVKIIAHSTANPTVSTDILSTVPKSGMTDSITGRHTSWSLDATKIVASTYLGDLTHVANTKWVADGPPIYRMDNFATKMTAILPLTPANLGEVWDNQDVLTYMGTTKASIVAPGQWAFDQAGPVGGTLWVRGMAGTDLTLPGETNRITAFDWRLFLDEITAVYTDELPGNTQKWVRICKVFSRAAGIGYSETSWTPRANLSPDGRFALFASTWGNRLPRKDIFAVDLNTVGGTVDIPPAAPTGLTVQ